MSGGTEKKDLWSSLLQDALQSSSVAPNSHVVFLGEPSSGKSSLVAALEGLDPTEAAGGMALEYGYLPIHAGDDTSEDIVSHMNLWQLEGEPGLASLLSNPLATSRKLTLAAAVLVIDITKPWAILHTLDKWSTLLSGHTAELEGLDAGKAAVKDYMHSRAAKISSSTTNGEAGDTDGDDEGKTDDGDGGEPGTVGEQEGGGLELPLTAGALEVNVGVPVIVAVTKVDQIGMMEREYGFTDSTWEFLQLSIRKWALKHGAATVYTSATDGGQIDTLTGYLKHRLYNFPLSTPPSYIDTGSVFIPAGWDSLDKMEALATGSKNAGSAFNDVIRPPAGVVWPPPAPTSHQNNVGQSVAATPSKGSGSTVPASPVTPGAPLASREGAVTVESDAAWLARLQAFVEANPTPNVTPAIARTGAAPGAASPVTPVGSGARAALDAARKAPDDVAVRKKLDEILQQKSPVSPASASASTAASPASAAPSPGGEGGGNSLAAFFSSLKNKSASGASRRADAAQALESIRGSESSK